MSIAIVKSVRECIILLDKQGLAKTEISKTVNISYNTVLKIIKRYKDNEITGLDTDYDRCGHKITEQVQFYKRICLYLKRRHEEWGAPIIRAIMTKRYGKQDVPCIRHMQKWFRAASLNKPRQRKGHLVIGHALAVHNIWQVDAKERFTLTEGQAGDYLNIVDEKSGAWLEAPLFPLQAYQSSAN
jgi:transposase